MRAILTAATGAALLCGCVFNAEEKTTTYHAERDLRGYSALGADSPAFDLADISVKGIDPESLRVDMDVRRLVTSGDDPVEDVVIQLQADDADSTAVAMGVQVSGEDWVSATIDRLDIGLCRSFDLTLAQTEGDVSGSGFDGFVEASSSDGDVSVEAGEGADIVTRDGKATATITDDSLFSGLTIETASGAISVKVPVGLRANVKVSTRGTIKVAGREVDDTEWEGALNGGDANRVIDCTSSNGSITIAEF